MAPEQIDGSVEIDARTDVWALGALLYQILSGKPPFEAKNAFMMMTVVLQTDPAPLSRTHPEIPTDLTWIVERCLEKQIDRRYRSARALAEDLERFLGDERVLARPTGVVYKSRKWLARHPTLAAR
jgi:serine/threonine-protein kinase